MHSLVPLNVIVDTKNDKLNVNIINSIIKCALGTVYNIISSSNSTEAINVRDKLTSSNQFPFCAKIKVVFFSNI